MTVNLYCHSTSCLTIAVKNLDNAFTAAPSNLASRKAVDTKKTNPQKYSWCTELSSRGSEIRVFVWKKCHPDSLRQLCTMLSCPSPHATVSFRCEAVTSVIGRERWEILAGRFLPGHLHSLYLLLLVTIIMCQAFVIRFSFFVFPTKNIRIKLCKVELCSFQEV